MAKAKAIQKVSQSTALAVPQEDWEIALAAKAQDEQASEVLGVPRITHRGSILKIDDKKIDGNVLKCVVVTYGFAKKFFTKAFDPDSPAASPECYAFASSKPGAEAAMKPHEAAPGKVSEACAGCQHNKFGTAEKGKGKRCSDVRRVLVLVGTDDPANVVKAQVRQIEVPPGSLRNWGNYQKTIKEISPYGLRGVVTEIGTEAQENGAYQLTFKATDRLSKDFIKALVEKERAVESELFTPFPVLETEEKPQTKRSAKSRAKVA
jgi:hypothetical protein